MEAVKEEPKTKAKKPAVAVPVLDLLQVKQLSEDKDNPRTEFGDIAELAANIKENGVKVALRVRATGEKTYVVTDGNRRLRALKSLGKDFANQLVKVEIEPEGYDEIQRTYDYVITATGLGLGLLEQADTYNRLREKGETDAAIAKKTGRSQMHIHDCLLLWDKASDKLKKDIAKGKISASTVIETLKAEGENTDAVVDKAKEIAGDKKVSGKHITEAQGKSKGSKINNTSSKPTKIVKKEDVPPGDAKPQTEATASSAAGSALKKLKEALLTEFGEGGYEKVDIAFTILDGLIGWQEKTLDVMELSGMFLIDVQGNA